MITLYPANRLRGEITVPGDKSISHRSVMLASLAEGDTRVKGFLNGADCMSTISCFKKMGVRIQTSDDCSEVVIKGRGANALNAPDGVLDVGNSGTTMRLMSGILAGAAFDSTITGDASIRKRPMKRIITPLTMMGANITSENDGKAPLHIKSSSLKGIHYNSPVASAQVKSCVLLAGLFADGETSVTEPALSRDHTERMLRSFGAKVSSEGRRCTITPHPILHGIDMKVPGDISSAAYWITAGLITDGSELLIKNVNINPTRAGIIKVVEMMGGDITLLNKREISMEPVCDILVRTSKLKGTVIKGDIIPALIDELPLVALLGTLADGETVISDAAELRVKESDRISLITDNLKAMGAKVQPKEDGMIIEGGSELFGAKIKTSFDHRIAMTFAIASLAARGETVIDDENCVKISYPDFFNKLKDVSS